MMVERACSSVNEPRAAHEQSHEDVPRKERFQLGAIPVTDVRRTLLDCVSSHVSLELIEADRA
jgi:hypothetical protein